MAEKADYIRQSGIIDVNDFNDNVISIIGCGAIGSFVGISLAKMGFTKFRLWDFDKVESHNLPNQFFTIKDIGENKAIQTSNHMFNFNQEITATIYDRKFKDNFDMLSEIVVCSVDTMETRKQVFEEAKKQPVQLFIDTRMGGLQGQIYFVDMDDKEDVANYEETLFNDKEAVKLRCTERSILFTVLGLSSLVCNGIVKALKNEEMQNYIVLDYTIPQMM